MELSPRVQILKKKISALYEAKDSNRAEWADWLYENHVFVVADYSGALAIRYNANQELAMAAGMLHDVADAVMAREDSEHEARSWEIARTLLVESGFLAEEISIVVDDAIRFHGCHGDNIPQTLVGKVMASGDALGHLCTDFYDYALSVMQKKESIEEIRDWAFSKIERDYRKKLHFEEVRAEITADYERVRNLFA